MIVCAALNIAGIRVVATTSIWLFFLLSAPFAMIVILAPFKYGALANAVTTPTTSHVDIIGGLLIAMWNYMGWDNASTIATEVKQPQRTYPRAMMAAVALVALSDPPLLVVALCCGRQAPAAALLPPARLLIWPECWPACSLRVWLVAGGMMSALRHASTRWALSYSRVPLAMAQDGLLPACFARVSRRTGVPWVSVIVLSAGWALCVGIGFERLVTLDVMLDGLSLLLEFVSLALLRFTAPELPRPFRVPGGTAGAIATGNLLPPCFSFWRCGKAGANTCWG